MAFDRDIKEESEKRDCVLIEFKALGATRDKKAEASSQVRRKYARSIKKFAPNVRNIFIYIITDIDDELKEDLISDDYKEAITRYGTMMNYYNPANEAHICFLCARTIIGDAKDRHDLFFKILDEELAYKQRAGIETQISDP